MTNLTKKYYEKISILRFYQLNIERLNPKLNKTEINKKLIEFTKGVFNYKKTVGGYHD